MGIRTLTAGQPLQQGSAAQFNGRLLAASDMEATYRMSGCFSMRRKTAPDLRYMSKRRGCYKLRHLEPFN